MGVVGRSFFVRGFRVKAFRMEVLLELFDDLQGMWGLYRRVGLWCHGFDGSVLWNGYLGMFDFSRRVSEYFEVGCLVSICGLSAFT